MLPNQGKCNIIIVSRYNYMCSKLSCAFAHHSALIFEFNHVIRHKSGEGESPITIKPGMWRRRMLQYQTHNIVFTKPVLCLRHSSGSSELSPQSFFPSQKSVLGLQIFDVGHFVSKWKQGLGAERNKHFANWVSVYGNQTDNKICLKKPQEFPLESCNDRLRSKLA